MTAIWAGIDAGKTHHHCVVIDDTGKRLLSRRVANEETELPRATGATARRTPRTLQSSPIRPVSAVI